MLGNILLSFLAFWIILLPVYLWGYGTTLVLGYNWHRLRFFTGILVGSLSVVVMYFLERYNGDSILMISGAIFLTLLIFLYTLVYVLTYYGSVYARGFLRRIALGHIAVIASIGGLLFLIASAIPSLTLYSSLFFSLLLVSLFEETSKHLVSIGLAGQDFHFSRGDIITFTLFSVLGFVFCENIIYLIGRDWSLFEWVYRSLFTLLAHIFAASICAYYWWKALSYELFSVKYFTYFTLGFLLAGGAHTFYNSLLEHGHILAVMAYTIIGYMIMVVMFARK